MKRSELSARAAGKCSFHTFDALHRLSGLQRWRCPPEEVPLGQCRPRPTARMAARGSLA